MNNTINLNTLSKEELITLLLNQVNNNSNERYNKIEVCDFAVYSYESLEVCKNTINELIEKHKDFAILRKIKQNINSNLGIG